MDHFFSRFFNWSLSFFTKPGVCQSDRQTNTAIQCEAATSSLRLLILVELPEGIVETIYFEVDYADTALMLKQQIATICFEAVENVILLYKNKELCNEDALVAQGVEPEGRIRFRNARLEYD